MKLLDKLIIKDFLKTYLFVVLMLILVVLVLDFTEKNDTYIRNDVPASEILQYMLNYGLYLNNLLTPITVFISVIFITSKMAGRTEIIAILSSGVSFLRMLVPFLFSAFLIAVVSFFLNGWVLPVATEGVSKFRVEYLDKGQDVNQQNIHIKVAPNLFAYMRRYFTSVNSGHDFTLENIKDGELISKFSAERIVWDTAKHVWNARNWRLREFNEMGETWTTGDAMDTTLSITPNDFDLPLNHHETLTLPDLSKQILILEDRGADNVSFYKIEKYVRFMSPFAAILLTFIGVIVSARKTRGGSGFKIALGFMLAFVYIILFLLSRTFAEAGTAYPVLAVWMPNIVFGITGLVLYKTVPR
ncbi:LptF/LptG family permease [Cyclobacterium marinum]|uniref:Permease YjgP/YjgQ family protein n=1 Tax=Cyclobacterium marinum (strain ATCC 25205 / DSM 745 / LMG 13164 / NCIMB 1802) TaxID=880070 RepID=G0J6R6_CYCMS|nr:LptF/LptG family permease [Cyclobacterium marinum]AEL26114.1 permease YjgP/YjgQ family protein [Cyclobacterium marinum DSM 745]MBI0399471.1 LptF/LptG family permease [Cyclobacterium marinum]MBR9777649.1 YjgP/YjgQ family permease [Cytophagales bacterium]|tara:strand:+ start:7376 stop:8449 length:1074 start_codon:yes stop_codon:yes gene_type:complete